MEFSLLVTLLATVGSALATIVLAVLTAKYVRLTNALVEETKAAKQPYVFIDIEVDRWGLKLAIGNSGVTVATDVRITVKDTVPWRQSDKSNRSLSDLSPIKSGIASLPPGRVLKYFAGAIPIDGSACVAGSYLDFVVTYKDQSGHPISRATTIDLASYADVLFESFSGPQAEVARAIRDTSARSDDKTSSRIEELLTTKACPSCAERIPRAAKKCPRCHEQIPEAKANGDGV